MEASQVKDGVVYWYIYIDIMQLHTQVKLLEVECNFNHNVTLNESEKVFSVLMEEEGQKFKSIQIEIGDDYANLYEDKELAEIMLMAEVIKHLKSLIGLDIGTFFEVYRKLNKDYPELLIK